MAEKPPLRHLLTTAGGLGHLPLAPGTWGSSGAALIALVIYGCLAPIISFLILIWLVLVSTYLGIQHGSWAEEHFGQKDPGQFVLDECAGQWLTCALFFLLQPAAVPGTILAFVAFRISDVAKPPPIRRIEKLPEGYGMMLDDLAAGLYAAATLGILMYFDPTMFGVL